MTEQLFLVGDEVMNEEDAIEHLEQFALEHIDAYHPELLDYLETCFDEVVIDETEPFCNLIEEAVAKCDCGKEVCSDYVDIAGECEYKNFCTKPTGKKFKFVTKITFELEEIK